MNKLILNYLKAFLSKGVGVIYGLILLKLLSIYLPESDFSNYYIYYNISFYIYIFFFSIQANAILRYYYIKGEKNIEKFVNSFNTLSILINLFFLIVFLLFDIYELNTLIAIFLLIHALGFFNNEINYLRITHSFDKVLYLFIAQAVISISGITIFNDSLDFNVVLIIISISFITPVLIFKNKKNFFVLGKIDFDLIKKNFDVVKYALPIVFIAISNSTMSSMDQIILNYYEYSEGLSSYIANYTIAEKSVVFLLSIITLVFVPTVFKKYDYLTKNVFKDIFKVVFVFTFLSSIIVFLLFHVSESLTITFTTIDFIDYSWVIPYIAIGGIFLGVNSIISEVFTVSKKTIILMICYISGMFTNFFLNIIFIPIYGIIGAVFTTIVTYVIMLFTTLFFSYLEFKKLDSNEIK